MDLGINPEPEAEDKMPEFEPIDPDTMSPAEVAQEMANWLGYWNVDFYGLRLPHEHDRIAEWSGIKKFDIVLALSVKQTRPVPWVFELCGGVCYFEGHVPDKEHTYRATLEEHFSRVEFLGMTKDHGPRPLFRCEK